MNTNAYDLGPLQILIGTWHGQSGQDVSPEPDGKENNSYREKLTFSPVRPFSNAEEQKLTALQYHQIIYRIRDNRQIHDQCGYISWDSNTETAINSLTIPRGLALLAGGKLQVEEGKHTFTFRSSIDDPDWPICQSKFLQEKATTRSFTQTISVKGSELNYHQTTVVDIYGKEFEHTDTNTLIRSF